MNQFLVVLLVCIAGNQFPISSGQSFTATARIRIQCVADGGMLGAPSTPPTTTTTGPTTTGPTTTTGSTTTTATTTTGSTTTTGAPAVTLPPVESGGGGSATIIYWGVNWSNALNNATGSIIVVSESTGSQYRCLGKNTGANTIGIDGPRGIPTGDRFVWNFISVFDSVSWTYRYQIVVKNNGRCLRKNGKDWDLAACSTTNTKVLFNLLS